MIDKPLIFQMFEAQQHSTPTTTDSGMDAGDFLVAAVGFPAMVATGVSDTGMALWGRRQLKTWVRAGHVAPFGPQPSHVLTFDLAGVCLVQACNICRESAQHGLHQIKGFATAVRGAVTGSGFTESHEAFLAELAGKVVLPLYRNFLMAGLAEAHDSNQIKQDARKSAERAYLRDSLSDLGGIPVPAAHPLHEVGHLGAVIKNARWHAGLRKQPTPRPDWSPMTVGILQKGRWDSLLGTPR